MALNFDKFITECDNVSLEDLSFESLYQLDLDPDSITLNDLFEDRLSIFNQTNNSAKNDIVDPGIFDLDIEYGDLDKAWISDCDINDPSQFDDINLADLEPRQSITPVDPDDPVDVTDHSSANESESSKSYKKNANIIRRQSTRIQNQTRKKIAEQIQRENVRLAMEAQLLNSNSYSKKEVDQTSTPVNGKLPISEIQKTTTIPTDLDASDDTTEDDNIDISSDDDPNKLWCICRQPYGQRFMICCDNCMEWYHGDCVGVTQAEGNTMDEFICPPCLTNTATNTVTVKSEEIVVIDDDDHEKNEEDRDLICVDDDDCQIIKAVEPSKFNSNIFQLINRSQHFEMDRPLCAQTPVINMPSLSSRTSVCLNHGCKTLVNPKKSLYCSRNCIDKYTRMVIKNNLQEKAKQYGLPKGPKLAKMTRFVLAQPATETIQDEVAAPTEENLKAFLLKNPTYKVYQSSKPIKTKEEVSKSKKFLELLNMDPSKHVKVVKHFATVFKKSMPLKTFKAEFRNIWQHCVKMEEGIFEICEKLINDRYMLKVKQISESLKNEEINKLCRDILHDKISISDLLSMNKDQLESRSKVIVLDEPVALPVSDKLIVSKKQLVATTGGISLLADTTHLHDKHLYDIQCRICNGASKSTADNRNKEKESFIAMENVISSCTEIVNLDDIPSPFNNDEDKVTSSVATPDMAVDMEICSSPSEKDATECGSTNDNITDTKAVSSSIMATTTAVGAVKPSKKKLLSLWEGDLTYKEVGTIACKSYLVTRHFLDKSTVKEKTKLCSNAEELRDEIDIGSSIDSQILINGRSQLSVVQDYFRKLRKHSNKEFIILRLHPTNLEEGRQTYLSMFEFFHSRERCGVVSHKKCGVKDCFIYPLNAHSKIPQIFLPFNGPGLEKSRPHLLLLLVVRTPLTQQYLPISPKYDEEHDFVTKHGINLDKYYKPVINIPFCPSPIQTADTVHISKSENKLTVTKTDKPDIETSKKDTKKVEKLNNKKSVVKTQKKESCYIDKTNDGICMPDAVKSEILKADNDVERRKSETCKVEPIKDKSIDKVASDIVSIPISKMPEIDLLNIPLPPPLPDIIPDISTIPIPVSIPPPIKKVLIATPPQQQEPIIAVTQTQESVVTSVPVKPVSDSSFTPQPFVYRSLIKPSIKTQDSNNNHSESHSHPNITLGVTHFIPELSNVAKCSDNNSKKSDEIKLAYQSPTVTEPDRQMDGEVTISNVITSETLPFSQDNDFRFPTIVNSDNSNNNTDSLTTTEIVNEQLIEINSQNQFLKRKCSNRLYTYYDSFELDESCQEKRLKYFFNPHNQRFVDELFEEGSRSLSPPSPSPSPPSPSPPPIRQLPPIQPQPQPQQLQQQQHFHKQLQAPSLNNEPIMCGGVILKKNVSVFSPPGNKSKP